MRGQVSDLTRFHDFDEEFPLESGDSLHGVRVAYRTWGEPREEATLICHALTGSADADEWWGGMFGPGRSFDPLAEYVIATNVLGGCYGTTGPTSPVPGTDHAYGPTFPPVTIRDIVRLQAALVEALGVKNLKMVIGGSMGGMQASEFAVTYPDRVQSAVSIGAGIAQSAWAMAFAAPQRKAIHTDPEFNDGHYRISGAPSPGLAVARMIAMISYRSHGNFESRFGRTLSEEGYQIGSYLDHQGMKLVERFDANSYLRLLDAMDSHDLTSGRGTASEVLASIDVPLLAVGISTDVLFPTSEVRDLAHAVPNGRYETLHAPQGHDGFLIEVDALNRIVSAFKSYVAEGFGPVSSTRLEKAKGAAWA